MISEMPADAKHNVRERSGKARCQETDGERGFHDPCPVSTGEAERTTFTIRFDLTLIYIPGDNTFDVLDCGSIHAFWNL